MDTYSETKSKKNIITYQESVFGCEVMRIICKDFGYTEHEVFKKSRYRKYVYVRQMCHYIIKQCTTTITLQSIGALPFNTGYNRDHATVFHSIKMIEDLLFSDKQTIQYIEEKLPFFRSLVLNYLGDFNDLSIKKSKIFALVESAETDEDLTMSLISVIA